MADLVNVGTRRPSWRAALDIAASLAMIGAAGLVAWPMLRGSTAKRTPPEVRIPAEPLSLEGAPVLGSAKAPVVIVEFSDFECPFCGRFVSETLPSLKEKYIDTGLVMLAFRHFPLPGHAQAIPAANAAQCAARQGKFWPMHDRLFTAPRDLAVPKLREKAAAVGVEMSTFEECQAEPTNEQVRTDFETAKALGLPSTPTFFLGTRTSNNGIKVERILSGAKPPAEFQRVLRDLTGR